MLPELNIAALVQHFDKEITFWYILRAIDVNGCGHVDLADAENSFLQHFGYSRRTFYRHLRLGNGKFWETYQNGRAVLRFYGLQKVFECLHTFKASKWVEVAVNDITQYPRKALLHNIGAYRPFGTGRNNMPMSRASLADVNKIDRRKQQRYDVAASTIRTETTVMSYDPDTHKVFKQKVPVLSGGKTVFVTRQAGNIYTSHATASHRGMIRKVSKEAKRVQESLIAGEAPHKELMPSKRFYGRFLDAVHAYMHGKNDGTDIYYPTKSNAAVFVQVSVQ